MKTNLFVRLVCLVTAVAFLSTSSVWAAPIARADRESAQSALAQKGVDKRFPLKTAEEILEEQVALNNIFDSAYNTVIKDLKTKKSIDEINKTLTEEIEKKFAELNKPKTDKGEKLKYELVLGGITARVVERDGERTLAFISIPFCNVNTKNFYMYVIRDEKTLITDEDKTVLEKFPVMLDKSKPGLIVEVRKIFEPKDLALLKKWKEIAKLGADLNILSIISNRNGRASISTNISIVIVVITAFFLAYMALHGIKMLAGERAAASKAQIEAQIIKREAVKPVTGSFDLGEGGNVASFSISDAIARMALRVYFSDKENMPPRLISPFIEYPFEVDILRCRASLTGGKDILVVDRSIPVTDEKSKQLAEQKQSLIRAICIHDHNTGEIENLSGYDSTEDAAAALKRYTTLGGTNSIDPPRINFSADGKIARLMSPVPENCILVDLINKKILRESSSAVLRSDHPFSQGVVGAFVSVAGDEVNFTEGELVDGVRTINIETNSKSALSNSSQMFTLDPDLSVSLETPRVREISLQRVLGSGKVWVTIYVEDASGQRMRGVRCVVPVTDTMQKIVLPPLPPLPGGKLIARGVSIEGAGKNIIRVAGNGVIPLPAAETGSVIVESRDGAGKLRRTRISSMTDPHLFDMHIDASWFATPAVEIGGKLEAAMSPAAAKFLPAGEPGVVITDPKRLEKLNGILDKVKAQAEKFLNRANIENYYNLSEAKNRPKYKKLADEGKTDDDIRDALIAGLIAAMNDPTIRTMYREGDQVDNRTLAEADEANRTRVFGADMLESLDENGLLDDFLDVFIHENGHFAVPGDNHIVLKAGNAPEEKLFKTRDALVSNKTFRSKDAKVVAKATAEAIDRFKAEAKNAKGEKVAVDDVQKKMIEAGQKLTENPPAVIVTMDPNNPIGVKNAIREIVKAKGKAILAYNDNYLWTRDMHEELMIEFPDTVCKEVILKSQIDATNPDKSLLELVRKITGLSNLSYLDLAMIGSSEADYEVVSEAMKHIPLMKSARKPGELDPVEMMARSALFMIMAHRLAGDVDLTTTSFEKLAETFKDVALQKDFLDMVEALGMKTTDAVVKGLSAMPPTAKVSPAVQAQIDSLRTALIAA